MDSALSRLDESGRQEFSAAVRLRVAAGMTAVRLGALLERYGSARSALRAEPGLAAPSRLSRQAADEQFAAADAVPGEIILWTDDRYPPLLKQIPGAPPFLYAMGDANILCRPCVAVVGSRDSDGGMLRRVAHVCRELSDCGICVVSGLAKGIDAAAHRAALDGQGGTIAVLGCGIDVTYPKENKGLYEAMAARGLLLSEFAPGTPPFGRNFPLRNRIISGLSLGVLVARAETRSGSLITANLAAEQNRDVFVLSPEEGMPLSSGCADLERNGAAVVHTAEDIVRECFHARLGGTGGGFMAAGDRGSVESGPPTSPPKKPGERDGSAFRTSEDVLENNASAHAAASSNNQPQRPSPASAALHAHALPASLRPPGLDGSACHNGLLAQDVDYRMLSAECLGMMTDLADAAIKSGRMLPFRDAMAKALEDARRGPAKPQGRPGMRTPRHAHQEPQDRSPGPMPCPLSKENALRGSTGDESAPSLPATDVLSENEAAVLRAVAAAGEAISADDLAEILTDMPFPAISSALLILEVKKHLARLPGGRFTLMVP